MAESTKGKVTEGFTEWWAYRHTNGSLQVKPYFGPQDISEAQESPFVKMVAGPFECVDRNDAIQQASEVL